MLALRFYAPEDLRLEDVPEPTCGTDDDDVQGLGAAGVHEVGISIS